MAQVEKKEMVNGKNTISHAQLGILVFLCYLGPAIATAPGALVNKVHQDAWIAGLLGVVGGIFVAVIYMLLVGQLKHRTIVVYMENLLGKYIGKGVGILFVLFLLLTCSTKLWIVGDFLVTHLMPETPTYMIHILFVVVVVIGTRLGIEVIARSAEIVIPWIIIGISIMFLFLLPQIKVENIQPILTSGVKMYFKSALAFMGTTSLTFVALLMVVPTNIEDIKKGRTAFVLGTLIGGLTLVAIITLSILVLGSDITERSVHPAYKLAKKIKVGELLQRVEVILAIVWFITVFYNIVIYFYGSVLGIAQIFNLKDYRMLTLPMAMILVVLSIIVYPSLTYSQHWLATTWLPFVLTYGLILPIMLLVIGKFKRK